MSAVLSRPARILAVDDEPTNLQLLRQILQEQYGLLFAKDGERALQLAQQERPDLILLDVMMPGMTGYDVCRRLKSVEATAAIPIIFVTALADTADELTGFEAGAVDYISKPVSPPIVKARVRTHLSLVRMDELRETRLQIVQRLGLAAEYKDNETGLHVIRMSHYARLLGLAAGMNEQQADDLLHAAPLHDVGKIGIPDRILQKPGKLDPDEWRIMQTHVAIGANIIGPARARRAGDGASHCTQPPREVGRQRLSVRTGRRGDSARRPHRGGCRRIRRTHFGAAIQEGMVAGGGATVSARQSRPSTFSRRWWICS